MCPFHAMANDYLTVNTDGLSAKGRYSGAVMRVGDILRVSLVRVDRLAGEAQFVPEGWPGKERAHEATRPRNHEGWGAGEGDKGGMDSRGAALQRLPRRPRPIAQSPDYSYLITLDHLLTSHLIPDSCSLLITCSRALAPAL